MNKSELHPFEPLIFENSKILILGSFPSLKSIENNFYYSHPQNQFWRVLSKLYDMPIETKEQKIELIKSKNLALWDSGGSLIREDANSSDTNLKNIIPNKIDKLLERYKKIELILFTGKKAEDIYKKEFKNLKIITDLLPSPSPAYASMSFEEKLIIYRDKLSI
jgi:double-stranded uracil-DNA glycosylase